MKKFYFTFTVFLLLVFNSCNYLPNSNVSKVEVNQDEILIKFIHLKYPNLFYFDAFKIDSTDIAKINPDFPFNKFYRYFRKEKSINYYSDSFEITKYKGFSTEGQKFSIFILSEDSFKYVFPVDLELGYGVAELSQELTKWYNSRRVNSRWEYYHHPKKVSAIYILNKILIESEGFTPVTIENLNQLEKEYKFNERMIELNERRNSRRNLENFYLKFNSQKDSIFYWRKSNMLPENDDKSYYQYYYDNHNQVIEVYINQDEIRIDWHNPAEVFHVYI